MKLRLSKSLRRGLAAAAVAAIPIATAHPAHACTWYEACLDTVAGWFVSAGKDVVVFGYRDFWGSISQFTCDDQNIWGINGACFGDHPDALARMRNAVFFLKADPRTDFTRGLTTNSETFSPQAFMYERIAYFVDGNADEAHLFSPDHGEDNATTGYFFTGHPAPVVIWPTAYPSAPTDATLASIIVHESDHTRFGAHTCGKDADTYEDGPYGTEIQYLGKIARTGNDGAYISMADRDHAWAYNAARIESKICNLDAQTRLWNSTMVDAPIATNAVLESAKSTWVSATTGVVKSIARTPSGNLYGVSTDGEVYKTQIGNAWKRYGCGSHPKFTTAVTSNESVYALAEDGSVYYTVIGNCTDTGLLRLVGSRWVQAAPGTVTDVSVTDDGAIYGLGTEGAVYRTTVGAGWWQPITQPQVKKIAVIDNGLIYGIGMDGAVYRTRGGGWGLPITDPLITSLAVEPNGFIYGVGLDLAVYMTRPNTGREWVSVTGGEVTSITMGTDGYIYGLGTDNSIWVHGLVR